MISVTHFAYNVKRQERREMQQNIYWLKFVRLQARAALRLASQLTRRQIKTIRVIKTKIMTKSGKS